jgi:hypothetical protein
MMGFAYALPILRSLRSHAAQKYNCDNCTATHVCEQHVMHAHKNTSPELAQFFAKNVVARSDLFSEN